MKRFGTFCFYLLAFGVAGYAVFAYGLMPLGSLVHPAMKLNYQTHPLGIYTHVFASLVALMLSPFQFSSRLRRGRPRLHRVLGRIYLGLGVLVGGLTGLYMSVFAFGGWVGKLGFACLALAWLFTGLRAFQAIRSGAVQAHRRWIVRNVSLTLAAVSLRIYLPLSMVTGIPFELAYPAIAWLCWVPNLWVAEIVFNKPHGKAIAA
ncbi:DUF2306 domain-containing protein [Roseateles oligotrophus]|uniref:DUF2306 domain-containing protein n=1 Tax=Roseateles oligotrophus TaxID=1769250 RepID=A0ABT2YCD8_9BURK|nr:DUF2306 domain-containing protein [Roseateles oligotrophus]MCV2367718.1 DUF2306 domain-containing protein [Roseateles oligotrophus]